MKRKSMLLILLICLITVMNIAPIYASSDTCTDVQSTCKGDVNLDGTVSIMDATTIQQYLASMDKDFYIGLNLDTECSNAGIIGDVDNDSNITIMDVTIIQKYLAHIPVPETGDLSVGDHFNYSVTELEKELYYKNYFTSNNLSFANGISLYSHRNSDTDTFKIMSMGTKNNVNQIMLYKDDAFYMFNKTNNDDTMTIIYCDGEGQTMGYFCRITDEEFKEFQNIVHKNVMNDLLKYSSIKNLNYTNFNITPPIDDEIISSETDTLSFSYLENPAVLGFSPKYIESTATLSSDTHEILEFPSIYYHDDKNSISFDYINDFGNIQTPPSMPENLEPCDTQEIIKKAFSFFE